MPLAFFSWHPPPRRVRQRRQYASLSRIALFLKTPSRKVDPAAVGQAEDKKAQKEKEKDADKSASDSGQAKEPAGEKGGTKSSEKKEEAKADGQEKGGVKSEEGSKEAKKQEQKTRKGTLGDLLRPPEDSGSDKPEKPLAARIVAYSDSEGEDEPFRLTRRRKKSEDAPEDAKTDEEQQEEPASIAAQIPQAIQNTPRLLKAARIGAKRGVVKLKQDASWGLLLQCLFLWLFRRRKRKTAQRLELLTLAIALPDALSCTNGWPYPSERLPGKLSAVWQFIESWARPAAAFQAERLIRLVLHRKKKRRRILTTISQSARLFEEAEQKGTMTPGKFKFRNALPKLAAEIASSYEVELTEMRRILEEEHKLRLPSERFDSTNAELLRFAASAGLLEATSPEEKAHAVQEAAKRVSKTLDWTRRQRFMPAAQLKEWHHIVRWQGTNSEGWPILVIKIAIACAQYHHDQAKAVSVGDAIIGQMHRAMTEVFSNQRGPDKVIVIMDASGANSLQVARHVDVLKETTVSLNRHYPYRLEKLFIVDLPSQLRWVLATLRHMLHPDTKSKIQLVSIHDPALPLPANLFQTPEEKALIEEERAQSEIKDKSRRVSIPELPVSRTPIPNSRPLSRLFNQRIDEEDEDEEEFKRPSPPRRRVRIMDLPFTELERKSSRSSLDKPSQIRSPTSGVLRPALKRSTSVGVLGLEIPRRSLERRSTDRKDSTSSRER